MPGLSLIAYGKLSQAATRIQICYSALAAPIAEGVRRAFYDAFTTFAVTADTLLSAMPLPLSQEAALSDTAPLDATLAAEPVSKAAANRRTLVLLANCGHMRSAVMPKLATKWVSRAIVCLWPLRHHAEKPELCVSETSMENKHVLVGR